MVNTTGDTAPKIWPLGHPNNHAAALQVTPTAQPVRVAAPAVPVSAAQVAQPAPTPATAPAAPAAAAPVTETKPEEAAS
jgi:hypothetical protein